MVPDITGKTRWPRVSLEKGCQLITSHLFSAHLCFCVCLFFRSIKKSNLGIYQWWKLSLWKSTQIVALCVFLCLCYEMEGSLQLCGDELSLVGLLGTTEMIHSLSVRHLQKLMSTEIIRRRFKMTIFERLSILGLLSQKEQNSSCI